MDESRPLSQSEIDRIRPILDRAVQRYNHIDFIADDPIQIPKSFDKKQDIEISAFWTAVLAWGQRKTIINKAQELFQLMDNAPHDFILNHKPKDLKRFSDFKHRTFQYTDTLYFIEFFKSHYQEHESLESAFTKGMLPGDRTTENALNGFREYFFSLDLAPQRTRKHVSSPQRKSRCKRINMFLRWMVRSDGQGVDLGLWKEIKSSQLLIPLDVHVHRTAQKLKLMSDKNPSWKSVLLLTDKLRQLDARDPVKYDFALFGLSVTGLDENA